MAFYALTYDKDVIGSTSVGFHVACAGAGSAGGSIRLVEVMAGGRNSTSTPFALAVNRPSASGTPGSATCVPAPLDNNSGAASFSAWGTQSVAATYTTAPTLASQDVLNFGFNAYGGQVRWAALPGAEIVAVATATTAGTASGANLVLGHIRVGTSATLSGQFIIEQR